MLPYYIKTDHWFQRSNCIKFPTYVHKRNLLRRVAAIFLTDQICFHLFVGHVTVISAELLRSAKAGRLYKLQSKHTSNSGFYQTFMPCSGYILFAAEQRVGYQISWVDLQREVKCP